MNSNVDGNRNLILGFAGGIAFAAFVALGILAADALTSEDASEPRLPAAAGDAIDIATGRPAAEVEAEVAVGIPVDEASTGFVPVESGGGGFGGVVGDSPDSSSGDELVSVDGPILADIAVPDLAENPFPDFYSDLPFFTPFRFVDGCADDSGLPGCPVGVGGTVLAPFDGGFDALGDFRLGTRLGSAPSTEECFGYVDSQPREMQHPIYLWANHPAEFNIRIYPNPVDDPDTVDVIVVGNSDSAHAEMERFAEDATEGRLATSPWPRVCFVLLEHAGDENYVVEVAATSFLGESASRTYVFNVPDGRRPPVGFEPFSDYDVRVYVPITETLSGAITVIDADDPTSCADVEADRRAALGSIIPLEDGRSISDLGRQAVAFPRAVAGTDPLDAAFDANQVINVMGLTSGTRYRVCVWWLEGADRSFSDASIVEREVHWFTTPDRPTARIEYVSMHNTSGRAVEAGEFRISATCPSGGTIAVPDVRLEDDETAGVAPTDRPLLCDYDGRRAPAVVVARAVSESHTQEFSIPLTTGIPFVGERSVHFQVDLSSDDRDPGRTDLGLLITYRWASGAGSGFDPDWSFGLTGVFEPVPEDPAALDDNIRIDTFASGVSPSGRDGISVSATFDRPVRLSAWVLPHSAFTSLTGEDPLCLTGERPTFTVDALSDSHSFRLSGLCTLTSYTVVLEAEDEAGNRGVFTDMSVPAALFVSGTGAFSDFAATGQSDGHRVEYLVENTAAPNDIHPNAFTVNVHGTDWDMRRSNDCFAESRFATSWDPALGGPRTAVWGDTVTVTIHFNGDEAVRGPDGCTSRGVGYSSWRASVTATFSIEDFESGVTIPVHATEATGDLTADDIDFNVTIRGSITD